MRTLFFFLIAFFAWLNSGHTQSPYYNNYNQNFSNSQNLIHHYKPDLDISSNIVVFTSGGQRIVRIYIKNKGRVAAPACNLKATYRWRIDHESWSNVELHKNYTIRSLPVGKITRIDMVIPDDDIHSNEGFGSNNVNITFWADSQQQINELSEQNNQEFKSVPIIH